MNTALKDRVIARINGQRGGLQKNAAARDMIHNFIYKEAGPRTKALKDAFGEIGGMIKRNPKTAGGIGLGAFGTGYLGANALLGGGEGAGGAARTPRTPNEKAQAKLQASIAADQQQADTQEELFDDYGEAIGYTAGGAGLGGLAGYYTGGQSFTGGALGALGGGAAGVLLALYAQSKRRKALEDAGAPTSKKDLIAAKMAKAQAAHDAKTGRTMQAKPTKREMAEAKQAKAQSQAGG